MNEVNNYVNVIFTNVIVEQVQGHILLQVKLIIITFV